MTDISRPPSAVEDQYQRSLRRKLEELGRRMTARRWQGPTFSAPEETVEYYALHGIVAPAVWEVWLHRSGVPNSYEPDVIGTPIRAAVRLTNAELEAGSVEAIAYKLAIAAAGREAHETLEWGRLDGSLVIDPHGLASTVDSVAEEIAWYLMGTAK